MMKYLWLILGICILETPTFAAIPSFNNLTSANLDDVMREFSANFTHTTASPPSTFGKKIFPGVGFEFGLIAGITKTPTIQSLVTTAKVDKLYHAGALLGFSFPYGLALETLYIPKTTVKDVSLEYLSFGPKWTITDVFWEWLPIKWGVKAHYSVAKISYAQSIQNSSTSNLPVNVTVSLKDVVWGLNTSIEYPLLDDMIQPYAGLGVAFGSGTVSILGSTTATFFGQGIPSGSQTANSSPSAMQFFGGLQLHFFVVDIAAEAMRVFGVNNYTGKFAFSF